MGERAKIGGRRRRASGRVGEWVRERRCEGGGRGGSHVSPDGALPDDEAEGSVGEGKGKEIESGQATESTQPSGSLTGLAARVSCREEGERERERERTHERRKQGKAIQQAAMPWILHVHHNMYTDRTNIVSVFIQKD